MIRNILYPLALIFHSVKNWIKEEYPNIIAGGVILALLGAMFWCHRPDTTPITVKNDCGLILDMDELPENRGYNIRTDKMFARTNLQSYDVQSVPVGSRLYYIEQASGKKGWLVEAPLPDPLP